MELNIQAFKDQYSEIYPFKNNFFKQKDFTQHYIDEGDHKAPVILMLHGNPTWSFYYRNLIKHFSKKYRVIVPDHMGCGFSDKPQHGQYELKNHVEHIVELLKYLKIEKFHLIVHDWGGAIGFGVATLMPENVLSAVILNTAAFLSPHIPKRISLCKNKLFGKFLVRQLNGFAWPATFMTTHTPLKSTIKNAYLFPYNNYQNRVAIHQFVQDIPLDQNHVTYSYLKNIENKLISLKFPKIIFWGGEDFCFNDHFYNKWCEIYPGIEKYYYQDAGHYVLEDKWDDIVQKLDKFYAK